MARLTEKRDKKQNLYEALYAALHQLLKTIRLSIMYQLEREEVN